MIKSIKPAHRSEGIATAFFSAISKVGVDVGVTTISVTVVFPVSLSGDGDIVGVIVGVEVCVGDSLAAVTVNV